ALRPGETLITDGHITARTRCGNQVAQVAPGKSSPLEPPAEDFDQPYSAMLGFPFTTTSSADPGLTPAPAPAIPAPTVGKRKWWLLPLFAAPVTALPHSDSSREPLAVTPEPGTTLLLLSGLAGVYWEARRRRKKD
ncbi:MAG TPA: PEP-CTERM sorting domain-containing protein, partial [Terriglobales bacterium]|nr:PEP-CTERM sorting domain-containing protein [Terriglobales bacterium]